MIRVLATVRTLALPAALAASVGLLGGCITVFPKSPPATLYRFGGTGDPSPSPKPVEGRPGVLLENVYFPRDATSDQILTLTGQQAAYISGSRWVSPAILLFTEATVRAYDARAQRVRVSVRGALGKTQGSVRVSVRDFQAEYRNGQAAAPTVVVGLHARLTRSDGVVVRETDLKVEKAAADNRVSAIAAGFDSATSEILAQLVDWTDQGSAGLADAPPVAIPPREQPPTVIRR